MRKRLTILACVLLAAALLITLVCVGTAHVRDRRAAEEWAQTFRDYYNAKVAGYEEENAALTPGEVDVVFLGDSLTDGYDLATYYPQYVTLNRGIGGDTTYGLEDRLQVSVYDVQPRVAVMLIGVNNLSTMLENYERILQGFAEQLPNTEIVLLSLTSMGDSWGRNNEHAAYNNVYVRALAEKYGYHFVDLYTALLNFETGEIHAAYTTDGGHLTPLGYTVFTETLTPVLAELLGK